MVVVVIAVVVAVAVVVVIAVIVVVVVVVIGWLAGLFVCSFVGCLCDCLFVWLWW